VAGGPQATTAQPLVRGAQQLPVAAPISTPCGSSPGSVSSCWGKVWVPIALPSTNTVTLLASVLTAMECQLDRFISIN